MSNDLKISEAIASVKDTRKVISLDTADQNTTAITNRVAGIDAIAQAIKVALVDKYDYGTIPGCGDKPTLLKPGADKIALLFGLVSEYNVTHRTVDYTPWTLNKSGKNYKTGEVYSINIALTGYFEYEMEVRLIGPNGNVVATGVGYCSNREKGKEEMPANSILKMAKKRAKVDAVVSIANLSSVFTQDLEDLKVPKPQYNNIVQQQVMPPNNQPDPTPPEEPTKSAYKPYVKRY